MEKLTENQYNLLIEEIYNSLIGASIPCECGEIASFGMGEMGECRDAAKLIVNEWAEKANIEIDF